MKKILITCNSSWAMFHFRYHLLNRLKKEYQVFIAAPKDDYSSKLTELGINFIEIKLTRKSINPIKELYSFFSILRVVLGTKPDLILNYTIKPNIYSSTVSRILGYKSINVVTGLGSAVISPTKSKFMMLLYKISKPKAFVFLNQDDMRFFKKHKISSSLFVINGEGIDLEKYQVSTIPPLDKKIVLFIGRMIKDKGIQEYIDASKNLPDIEFQALGSFEGEYFDLNSIKYLGKTNDVRPFIEKAHIIALPSYREGIPFCLLEACAMGKAIVATDVPGCKELVNDNGMLCKPHDAKDLSDKISKVFETLDLEICSKQSRNIATQFSYQKSVEQMMNILLQYLD